MKRVLGPRRAGRGTLTLVASMLFVSATIRVFLGAEAALAVENGVGEATLADMEMACEPETDISQLLVAFDDREVRLSERERQIEERFQALQVADREIADRLAELRAAEAALAETLSIADSAAETDLGILTAVYENMAPKEAAALFEEMTPDFAAGFLGRMRPDAAAEVMAGLEPRTAYSISVILAGRNADVPTE